ncbi:MAG: PP2C family serine/threonine-protein phosphatase [Betaproteobacteria bacterium]
MNDQANKTAASHALPGLSIELGSASTGAPGKPNEDFHAILLPRDSEATKRGMIVALADGISGSGSARAAAETTVRVVLHDYYATPGNWSVGQRLDRLLCSANDWQWAQNARRPDQDSIVTAVSVMVLREKSYYLAHVGDIRVYRLREDAFVQLTQDHTWQRRDMRHVLRRAIGLDSHLVVDFGNGTLAPDDCFMLVTDGVWEVLGDHRMAEILRELSDPQAAAESLVATALEHQAAYMGRNDATAMVIRITKAPHKG